jgi:hypothetical protein
MRPAFDIATAGAVVFGTPAVGSDTPPDGLEHDNKEIAVAIAAVQRPRV